MLKFSLAIALSLFFVHNNLRLADKLCQVDYSETSLEWAETDTDSDIDCELWFIACCRTLAVERLCFMHVFQMFFINVKKRFFMFFYSQFNVFNIYGLFVCP